MLKNLIFRFWQEEYYNQDKLNLFGKETMEICIWIRWNMEVWDYKYVKINVKCWVYRLPKVILLMVVK
jgi:hypothetical protein